MNNLKSLRRWMTCWMTCWMTWSLAAAGVFTLGASMAASQPPRPLAANDVSILFPAPRNAKDLTNLIPLSSLNGPAGQRARLVGRRTSADSWRSPKIRRRRSPEHDFRSQLPAEVKTDRCLVHRRHPHRSRRARPLQGGHRAVRPAAADPVDRAAGDAIRRQYPGARHRRASDFQLLGAAARGRQQSADACPAPSRTWPRSSPSSATSLRCATSLRPEHSGKPRSIPRVRSMFIRVCPAHPPCHSGTRCKGLLEKPIWCRRA